MDTRTKIVSLAQARIKLEEGNWLVVAGYFDPMTAAVAQRLDNYMRKESGRRVLIAVLEDAGALLTSGERSVLVAALRIVDNVVVISRDNLASLAPDGDHIRSIVDFEADRTNSHDFSELVLGKELSSVRSDGKAS